MKSKIMLTALVVMGLAYPGLGRAETFPSDGYMQENKTYESAATACENGYHVTDSVQLIERAPLIDVDVATPGNDYDYNSSDKTWNATFDYGTVYGRASCQSAVHSEGMGYVFFENDLRDGAMTAEDLRSGLEPIVGAARADAMVAAYEEYLASAMAETDQEALYKAAYQLFGIADGANYSTTDSGQYCYCQMTDYAADGGEKSSVAAAPWVFNEDNSSASICASFCANSCALVLHPDHMVNRVFRGAVFGSLGTSSVVTCDANEISITWTDVDPADVSANNAGVCTFGGDISTPVKAVTKPGKIFKGWKFDKAE